MSLDLLVFGPHPDDIEIGLGGTIAKHASLGLSVGLCDLTAGEMGSNGTPEQRLLEAEQARVVLGAAWRENLRWPDRRIGKDPITCSRRWPSFAGISLARSRCRTGRIAIPITALRARSSTKRRSTPACAAIGRKAKRGSRTGSVTTSSTTRPTPSFVIDVSATYDKKRQALDCHKSQFQRGAEIVDTRLNTPLFRQLVESRDAQFGALAGARWAEGVVVREPVVRSTLVKGGTVNIGIVCYASVGGSGIIATELGKALASRGHRVHILSSEMPVRLGVFQPGLFFHRVETPSYPLFREPQYLLSLANKIVQVSRDEQLDIVHAHYAIPHATAGYLARQILASTRQAGVPRVITTLHGTDITLLGSDRSYSETVAFCIQQSDGVTAVSDSLKRDTIRELGITREIRVIPNFIDCSVYRRLDVGQLCERARPLAPEAPDSRVQLPARQADERGRAGLRPHPAVKCRRGC